MIPFRHTWADLVFSDSKMLLHVWKTECFKTLLRTIPGNLLLLYSDAFILSIY